MPGINERVFTISNRLFLLRFLQQGHRVKVQLLQLCWRNFWEQLYLMVPQNLLMESVDSLQHFLQKKNEVKLWCQLTCNYNRSYTDHSGGTAASDRSPDNHLPVSLADSAILTSVNTHNYATTPRSFRKQYFPYKEVQFINYQSVQPIQNVQYAAMRGRRRP